MPDAATCMHRVGHDWSDLAAAEMITLGEVRERQYHLISLTCAIWNMTQMNLFMKQTLRCRKQTYGYHIGKGGEEVIN